MSFGALFIKGSSIVGEYIHYTFSLFNKQVAEEN